MNQKGTLYNQLDTKKSKIKETYPTVNIIEYIKLFAGR